MDEIIFEISNESERFIITGPLYIFAIGVAVFTYLTSSPIHWVFIDFLGVLLIAIFIDKVEYKVVPWDKPDVIKIVDGNILFSPHHKPEHEFQKFETSHIKKIIYKNNRFNKYIELWMDHNKYGYEQAFTAPAFWNGPDEWQQLVEEIRNQLPTTAQVIKK